MTVPKSISKSLKNISVNGLLAADFALDVSPLHAPWRAVLPTKTDFQESMPIFWDLSLQSLLPQGAFSILQKQKEKITSDFAIVSSAFPDISYSQYLYTWLLVSTRTFFFTSPRIKRKPLIRDDCLALIPLADLFNHSDVGCDVSYSPSGYSITANQDIEEGQEVYISYGNHSNDFLLVEYGFILADGTNCWDQIALDELLCPLLDGEKRVVLEEEGFWGRYVLDGETVCYRTQVVLGMMCMPINKWRRALAQGFDGVDERCQREMEAVLGAVLGEYKTVVEGKIVEVDRLGVGMEGQEKTLARRWRQIHKMVSDAIRRIESKN